MRNRRLCIALERNLRITHGSADQNLNIDEKVRIILSFFPQFADYKARAYADELAFITAQTHPNEPKAFSLYGDVLFQEQKYPEAIAVYKKALVLNDQVYQIWEQVLRIDITESKFRDAIKDGEDALAIFPNQAPLYLFTSVAYAQMHNHEKAIAYLKNAALCGTAVINNPFWWSADEKFFNNALAVKIGVPVPIIP